jgi:polysaccharide export outer membrane protein
MAKRLRLPCVVKAAIAVALLAVGGCSSLQSRPECVVPPPSAPPPDIPRELSKVAMPRYVIEPPDILLIDAIKIVPKPPYKIGTLDILFLRVTGTLTDAPIEGTFPVEPGGIISLGQPYGSVQVAGLTVEEATEKVHKHLEQTLRLPTVTLQLAQTSALQQVAGEHLVGQDGTVSLGLYGDVYVAGMTKLMARQVIEAHLSQYLDDPQVSVDVLAYNSKVYYIITQGAGLGDALYRLPITGNETVLDGISQIEGLQPQSSPHHIWIARPGPPGMPCQILDIDWYAITMGGGTETNYQLMPGDRIYVAEDKLVATDAFLAKLLTPVERLFGFALLGGSTVRFYKFFHQQGGVGGGGGGF